MQEWWKEVFNWVGTVEFVGMNLKVSFALISCDFALSVWSLWQDCPLNLLLNATDLIDVMHKFCSSPSVVHLEFFLQSLGQFGIIETY